ncbi:MAG: hypothetical protein A2X05_01080 [Bacteroidetes bacterium GWE2_41_25]|nr:MAG: hypothetical protein A2X03_13950 [Bacteroidetes bacterium GWA2_40_15]OFX93772.1 MAG: hypothetical protein A2X05_01080 [Bacteroidetes bacterium GWE2_41_25]OFX98600.1 MAG: hypothetical protein A2X06_01875 [Bacteroidetes bacterium GWC2_40_22]OFY58502.1 MAG: hypothetical protein A2X04_02895 [Bacteroidetes bacterium GWF2_41_9]HAM10429.1 hypothetical protein [Bacteroidales bacterium]
MNRTVFLEKVIRFILFGVLALIAVLTGSRAVIGNECTACPGKGICRGESDCSIFLSDRK